MNFGENISFTAGIWKICITVIKTTECLAISCGKGGVDFGVCDKTIAAKILLTCTCIIAAISALCFFLVAQKSENINQKLLLTMKILVFISLIMGIISVSAVIIATRSTIPQLKLRLGVSAYLGIIAIIINLIGAIIAVLIK